LIIKPSYVGGVSVILMIYTEQGWNITAEMAGFITVPTVKQIGQLPAPKSPGTTKVHVQTSV
jgi:hypothetical protein